MEDMPKVAGTMSNKDSSTPVTYPWPHGVVPYVIHDSIAKDSAKNQALLDGMNIIMKKTANCIQFVPRNNHLNYTHFTGDISGDVGMKHGALAVNIGDGCGTAGIVMHELLHALGFWHEHSRQDRDEYVNIHYGNIIY
ncbi:ASTA-like protein, partial [Mya arenaria]